MTAAWKGRTLELPIALTRMLVQHDELRIKLGDEPGTVVATPFEREPPPHGALQAVRIVARSYPRALEALQAFVSLASSAGVPPMMRDVAAAMGVGPSGAHHHIRRLAEADLLEQYGRGARCYRVAPGVELALHVHLRTQRDAVGVSRATRVA